MAFCTGCGKELKPGVRFCTACGKPVPGAAPVPRPAPASQPPQEKKSRALPIILIALIVLLLAGAALWWFVLRDADEPDDDTDHGEKTEQTEAKKTPAGSVSFSHEADGDKEYAVITGKDDKGDELWTVETDAYGISQLDRVQEIGVKNNQYYYIEDGDVVALSLLDGSELWRNGEFHGALGGFVFADNGALYLCGYFGPDVFVVNKDGDTVDSRASLQEGFIWPYDISFTEEGALRITYEQTDAGGWGTIMLNPDTLEILAVSGEGTAEPETPRSISLSASSALQEAGHDHSPHLAMDGSSATAWVEGAGGNGEGEWLKLDLGSDCHVSGMQIWAGYQKSDSLFYKNSRPARVRVTFSDGTSLEADLADATGMQSISFGGDRVTSSITVTILSVYPGSAYADTCISEITLS